MTHRKIPIKDASAAQLRKFAIEHLGLEVKGSMNRQALIALIGQAWTEEDIRVEEAPPEAVQSHGARARASLADGLKPGYARVQIHVSEEPGGTDPVPLGVNGSIMLVERGKDQDIPYRYYIVLKNAIKYQYDMDGDKINPIPRQIPQYPFSVIAINEPEEAQAA